MICACRGRYGGKSGFCGLLGSPCRSVARQLLRGPAFPACASAVAISKFSLSIYSEIVLALIPHHWRSTSSTVRSPRLDCPPATPGSKHGR